MFVWKKPKVEGEEAGMAIFKKRSSLTKFYQNWAFMFWLKKKLHSCCCWWWWCCGQKEISEKVVTSWAGDVLR